MKHDDTKGYPGEGREGVVQGVTQDDRIMECKIKWFLDGIQAARDPFELLNDFCRWHYLLREVKDNPDITEDIIIASLEHFMHRFGNLLTKAKEHELWSPKWERYVALVRQQVVSFDARWKVYSKDVDRRNSIFKSTPSVLQSTLMEAGKSMTVALTTINAVSHVTCRATRTLMAMSEEILIRIAKLSTYGLNGLHRRNTSDLSENKGPKYEVWIESPEQWNTCCRLRKVCRQLQQVHKNLFKDVKICRILD